MKKAFTLIELLVVVLIIGILSAVALPQYQKAVEKARVAEALVDIGVLSQAVDRFLLDNGMPQNQEDVSDKLDIAVPNTTKFSIETVCGSGTCHVTVTQVAGNYYLYVWRDSLSWHKSCTYMTPVGKGVCDGLAGDGYTVYQYAEPK